MISLTPDLFVLCYGLNDMRAGMPVDNGDVNMDGVINVLDIVFTVNFVLGLEDLSAYQQQLADMNADGTVNILDIILIVNIILGN